jgi:hypothetical protein
MQRLPYTVTAELQLHAGLPGASGSAADGANSAP